MPPEPGGRITAGFVTGGGAILSPLGAYQANPALSGRANFAFVSRYKPGDHVPSGDTQFSFNAAGFKFKSTSYDWLAISAGKAQYKGVGNVNDVSGFGFLLTAYDGDQPGGDGIDRFRLKIWRLDNVLVYDSNPRATADDLNGADPQAIASGSIVVRKTN